MSGKAPRQILDEAWHAAKTPRARTALYWLLFYRRICGLAEERPPGNAGDLPPGLSRFAFVIPPGRSWSDLGRTSDNPGPGLDAAFQAIEEANPLLAGLLSQLDFSDSEELPGPVVRELLRRFDDPALGASALDDDAFAGLAEELRERISLPGGPGTPRRVAGLLVEILQLQEGMSIYDGACGSGGLLLECHRSLKRMNKNPYSLRFYGQEADRDAWALCRMAMLCHGVDGAMIEAGDTLRVPRHLAGDGRTLLGFDRVITHPPFSLKEWGFDEWSAGDPYGRDVYGVPPRSCADLAFLEHSIACLNPRGVLGALMPHGSLFRGREEGEIRRRILQDDLVEAAIGLAPDLLPSLSVPACLLVLNKAKPRERREKVLVVDGGSDLQRIASAFPAFSDQEHFCRVVSLHEIARNDFTLGISRYIPPGPEEPAADVEALWQTLQELIRQRSEAEKKMADAMERVLHGDLRDDTR